jgi:hypothetical protein
VTHTEFESMTTGLQSMEVQSEFIVQFAPSGIPIGGAPPMPPVPAPELEAPLEELDEAVAMTPLDEDDVDDVELPVVDDDAVAPPEETEPPAPIPFGEPPAAHPRDQARRTSAARTKDRGRMVKRLAS